MVGMKESIRATGDDFGCVKMEGAELLRIWGRDGFDCESCRAVIASVTFAGFGLAGGGWFDDVAAVGAFEAIEDGGTGDGEGRA